ncbi:LysR substrate-binding domain-containing protein [Rhizobium sp. YJ-22]|uniref:LysR substrate-binding domain-containing protein n=1 Tax=Rhizobium sp. YJ-22 TaxID=3037556 RepID=UPI002412DBC2|nr:LysR substrate-binding domain-containing protein [Rhizobium sp. YJ-22]MDG3579910.1 LysR substrate-binding domain-containing protein [Rhizobium sp. YJ-22]
MTRIPSTQALRALESFARHGSVWKAADELNLTRSAVSHQLRLLERDLGFQLLNRIGTRVELTEQGMGYALDVRRALSTIAGSAARHSTRGIAGRVHVSSSPGFAASWLCPQIGLFQDAHPDVRLSITTPGRLDDVSNPDVDVFIAFGNGHWPDMLVEQLVDVEFTPLCSPVLVNKGAAMLEPADVLKLRLLHLVDYTDWETWFRNAGLDPKLAQTGVVLSDMNLVYSASVAAQGVAMGDEFISRQAMEMGHLVRLFDVGIRPASTYYLVVSEGRARNEAVAAFCTWLKHEVRKTED